MKQQILDALKAKFEGVSDAILGRIADKLAKTATTAEEVETAVAGVTFQQVLESYGDSRATEAQQSAVSNYEKKHNLKDGKPIEKQEPPKPTPPTGGEDVPAWAKELIESNKKAYEEINRLKAERTTETRQAQLSKLTEKLPEPIRKAYGRISVDNMTDEDFTALLNDVNGETEAISQTLNTPRGGSGRPFVAAGAGDRLTKAQEEAITKQIGAPAPDGQPF
jgi:t-SNARE complex subunit (syntaxin)